MDRFKINPDINSKIMFTRVNPNHGGMCVILHSIHHQYKNSSLWFPNWQVEVRLQMVHLICERFPACIQGDKILPWPPTAEDLGIKSHLLPDELQKILNVVLAGNPEVTCEKNNRMVLSIVHDTCRSVTNCE